MPMTWKKLIGVMFTEFLINNICEENMIETYSAITVRMSMILIHETTLVMCFYAYSLPQKVNLRLLIPECIVGLQVRHRHTKPLQHEVYSYTLCFRQLTDVGP